MVPNKHGEALSGPSRDRGLTIRPPVKYRRKQEDDRETTFLEAKAPRRNTIRRTARESHQNARRAQVNPGECPLSTAADIEFQQFIDRHVKEMQPLHDASCLAWWNASTTGKNEYQLESASLEARIRTLYSDSGGYRYLQDITPRLSAPELARQGHLLLHAYAANQASVESIERTVNLEKSVEADFTRHRARVDGVELSDNEIKEVLELEESEPRRRAAWEGSKQVGPQVCDRVLELVELRNEQAHRSGYPDYFHMQLDLQDLDVHRLARILDTLHEQTEREWCALKQRLDGALSRRFGCSEANLRPWHYADPFFQELPTSGDTQSLDHFFAAGDPVNMVSRFYNNIGLDVSAVLARSDLYERPQKSQHAFCIHIDRAGDVRILCNLKPDEFWVSTLLHELGHATYDLGVDGSLPFLLREPAHTLLTEAVAMFMGRLTRQPDWLAAYAGVSKHEATTATTAMQAAARERLLVFLRWALVVVNFERALYADPRQPLGRLWWHLVEKYQHVHVERDNQPDWASKIHIATAPVYYQNYIYGEMVASQMLAALTAHLSAADNASRDNVPWVEDPRVGRWFKERIFAPGSSQSWEQVVAQATGEPPDPRFLVASLIGA